ncbi:DEAD/DEAH box helicase [Pseudoclavibacter sp. RFBA6]|uniref:DEAD/DEAH box helicase n=1 Tax=Pseudoclavibacter sp. RFBA6 TaxID=2080573 RepID=UPI000CE92879|nr:DEAD/DEAH box helicase [Pseudoclavibacter sp. RFBA6]
MTLPSETPAPASWRNALTRLLEKPDAAEASSQAAPQERLVPLALQFEVRELIPRTMYRWNGPTSRRAFTGDQGTGVALEELRLGVRPVMQGVRGKWVKGDLTWAKLQHLRGRRDLDPRHQAWFAQFFALHRAARPAEPGQDSEWMFLDEATSPVMWTMLEEATSQDIAFVGTAKSATIALEHTSSLTLDARRTDTGLTLAPLLMVGEAQVDFETARPIGDHGIYTFDADNPDSIRLAPSDARLTPAQLVLLAPGNAQRARFTVPSHEAAEFEQAHLAELAAHLRLGSADASVRIPDPAPAELVLTTTFGPRHSLELRWKWANPRSRATPPALSTVIDEGLLPRDWMPEDADAPGSLPVRVTLTQIDAARFAAETLPLLERQPGVRVETVGTPPEYRELRGAPNLTVTTVPTERHDWFDLGVTVTVDGKVIPFTKLFKALALGRPRLLLIDGSYLSLKHPAFEPLRELISEAQGLNEWEPNRLQISRRHASLWSDFEDLADEAKPAVEWRELLRELQDDAPSPIAPPRGLQAELRPYQQEGLDWLAFLWRNRLGGILADDMGLGKTLQTLALAQHAREEAPEGREPAPLLVVAPTSAVGNWASEAARFTPGLVARVVDATQASSGRRIADVARGASIVVTSYALFRLDFEAYRAVAEDTGWSGLVLDEAQFVKNANSLVSECARELEVPFKLAITGTPLENSLTELHALLAITAPGLFPSARRFGEEYVRTIEGKRQGVSEGVGAGLSEPASAEVRAKRLARLRARIRPFLLRRTKERVAPELPEKQEQTLFIELSDEHRELYDLYLQRERQKLFGLLEDLDKNRFTVFRSLTLLRLLALDPALIHAGLDGMAPGDVPSSKLDALLEHLADVAAEGHRALVFSQFTSYLKLVAARLETQGIPYVYLDGTTTKRADVIASFKEGTAPVFLISLKAGGFGLNLTEADYVFLLDPWWNPASEEQAIDRTHRIGQERRVMVYRMIAEGTIEEKVMALKERKSKLFDAVIDDDELFSTELSADDIRGLLL